MKKGVVVKIKQNSAIIMADDCMFYEVKVFNGMYKGMEICFSDSDIIVTKIQPKVRRHINVASFILFVLCGYLFFNFYQENYAAYAYVGIDINPSIELSLNKKEQIIGVRGIDEEGKKIVSGLKINKMRSTEGVKEIIKKAIEENYLGPDSNNEITVYTIMEKNNDTVGNEIVNKIEDAVAEEVSINSIKGEIKTLVSDKNIKKKADNKGVSVVEYLSDDSKEVMNEKNNKKNEKRPSKKDDNKQKNNNKKEDKEDREDRENDDYDNDDDDEEDDDLKKDKKENNKKEKNRDSKNNKNVNIKNEDNKKYKNENDKNKDNKNIEKEENKNKKNHNKNNKIDENKNQDKYKEKIKKEKENNKNKHKNDAGKDEAKSKVKNKIDD